jgi:hypothetical protein
MTASARSTPNPNAPRRILARMLLWGNDELDAMLDDLERDGTIRRERLGPLDDVQWKMSQAVEAAQPDYPLHNKLIVVDTRERQLRTLAWQVAINLAAGRVVTQGRRCPHLRDAPAHEVERGDFVLTTPTIVALSANSWTCFLCASTFAGLVVNEDDCDLCDERSRTFHEFGVWFGRTEVTGNVCADCLAFAADEGPQAA